MTAIISSGGVTLRIQFVDGVTQAPITNLLIPLIPDVLDPIFSRPDNYSDRALSIAFNLNLPLFLMALLNGFLRNCVFCLL